MVVTVFTKEFVLPRRKTWVSNRRFWVIRDAKPPLGMGLLCHLLEVVPGFFHCLVHVSGDWRRFDRRMEMETSRSLPC